MKETFEDYLKQVHAESFPTLLDDDMSDHYDDWLGTLDGEDYIKLADDAIRLVKEGKRLDGITF